MKQRTSLLALFTLVALAAAALAVAAPTAVETFVVKGSFDVPADKNSPGSLATQIQFVPAVSGGSVSPSTDQILLVFEPAQPPNLPAVLPSFVVSLPGGCLVPHKSGGWALGDGSAINCGFELFHLFPDQSKADLTPFVTDVGVRLVEVIATKSWDLKLRIDFIAVDAAGIVTPSMIFATVGNHTGMANLTTKIEFFGLVGPMD
ncbi:MAG: hypothetical protein L0Z53_06060 [Acidobacteriales bacterium]|nr:hypothetical protein [Terriglobales bacterium]